MADPAIRLERVGCSIEGRALLKGVTWDLEPGSRWVVFGSNGCGKTTLLSLIAGFGAYEGSIKVDGAELDTLDLSEWRKSVAFVSGSFFGRVYHNETVLTLMLGALHGALGAPAELTDPADMRLIRRLLAHCSLEHRLDSPFNTLSKGEQQMVLVMRALLHDSKTMLLDEPMSGLDVKARAEMQRLLFSVADKRDATMVYVSHRLEEITPDHFDFCLLLSRGRVAAKGPIEEVMASQAAKDVGV